MAMRRIDRVVLAVHDAAPPTQDEWLRWIALCSERKETPIRVMVESYGGGPIPRQRRELAEAARGLDVRAAILTNSRVTRGIATAVSWLNLSLNAFTLEQHQAAAEYLGLSTSELSRALAAFPELRAACGVDQNQHTASG